MRRRREGAHFSIASLLRRILRLSFAYVVGDDACATVADWKGKKRLLALVGLSLANIFFGYAYIKRECFEAYAHLSVFVTSNHMISTVEKIECFRAYPRPIFHPQD